MTEIGAFCLLSTIILHPLCVIQALRLRTRQMELRLYERKLDMLFELLIEDKLIDADILQKYCYAAHDIVMKNNEK